MPSNFCRLKREILTVAETAAIYGVSIDTVHRWINEGALPAFQLGRGKNKKRYGIRPEALKIFEERRAIVPPAPSKPMSRPKPRREFV